MSAPLATVLGLAAFAVVLLTVILIHEAGHFVVAKLSGIRVDEFAFGFGPRLLSHRWGETVYSLRALPAGGFVRMAGMLGIEGEADAGPRNFRRASVPRRLATIVAGIVANLLLGATCMTVAATLPLPSTVVAGGAVSAAGMRSGDVITAVNGVSLDRSSPAVVGDQLHAATDKGAGMPLQLTFRGSDGASHAITVHPQLVLQIPGDVVMVVTAVNGHPVSMGDPVQVLGAGTPVTALGWRQGDPSRSVTREVTVRQSADLASTDTPDPSAAWRLGYGPDAPGAPLPTAVTSGLESVPRFVSMTVGALAQHGTAGLSGPIGIYAVSSQAARNGAADFIAVIGEVSLSVAFLNVLPIPFLDGGRLLFIVIEAVRRRSLDPRIELTATAVGLALLVTAAVFITVGDASHFSSLGNP